MHNGNRTGAVVVAESSAQICSRALATLPCSRVRKKERSMSKNDPVATSQKENNDDGCVIVKHFLRYHVRYLDALRRSGVSDHEHW